MPDDIISEAKEKFEKHVDAEKDNRSDALDDIKFARLGEQWPSEIQRQRQREGRPCLTINKMPAFIRQVVNDARQNKPSIKVHPVDSTADPKTADVYNGLIRNIEYASNADVAYDTATEHAVSGGFGYFRVGLDYAYDDTFDLDLTIDRVSNPFSIYGDYNSTAADSCDWCSAFVVKMTPNDEFEQEYKGADKVDWEGGDYASLKGSTWLTDDSVMIAEWWTREEVEKTILLLSDGQVVGADAFRQMKDFLELQGVTVQQQRKTKSWKVKQTIMTGAEVLKEQDWPGIYIPIVPVYGDEVDIEGKRYFRSLVRDAKDAQRMFNFWRTASTELVALAPKAPFIGKTGAFKTDGPKWSTANIVSHQYIEYDGAEMPQRQPFAGPPAGALQEALNASDDMKAIMGLYDASLGARSNETSGRAILARQREGDVSTFHFQDNMSRAIRHAGRILIDLIPKVYNQRKIVRVLGQDGSTQQIPLKQPTPVMNAQGQPQMGPDGNPALHIYDLAAGKYDLTVTAGPSFTTRREEAAAQMTEMIRAFPPAAPVIGDLIAKNLDWPGADEVAERLKMINPALQQQGQGIPPEMQKAMSDGQQQIQQLMAENQQLKADKSIDAGRLQIDQFKAESERMKILYDAGIARADHQVDRARAVHEMTQPAPQPAANAA